MFVVNHTNFYRESAVSYSQQLLNTHMRDKQGARPARGEVGAEAGAEAGVGAEAREGTLEDKRQ